MFFKSVHTLLLQPPPYPCTQKYAFGGTPHPPPKEYVLYGWPHIIESIVFDDLFKEEEVVSLIHTYQLCISFSIFF